MAFKFANVSLRWKLASVTVFALTLALVATGFLMSDYDVRTYQREKVAAIKSTAEILAQSVATAIVFNDDDTAQEYLKPLDANPEIIAGAVYDATGKQIAQYKIAGAQKPIPERSQADGHSFDGGDLNTSVSVTDNEGSKVGTIYLRTRVESAAARRVRYIGILLFVGLIVLAGVLPIALWLHRLISNPLEQLAASNAIIKTTFASVDHAIVVVSPELKIIFLNEQMMDLFGEFNPFLKLGGDFGDAMRHAYDAVNLPSIDDNDGETHIMKRLTSRDHLRGLYTMPNGQTLQYRQSPLPAGGFVCTYTDISEEKHLQEQLELAKAKAEEADAAKSHFLAAMSHEIRTPMNGVIGVVELLRSTSLNAEQRQMIDIVRQSGVTLLDVINDILDYSKIEAGRMTVEKTEFPLSEIVESTAAVIGGHTKSKFLDISCFVDPAIDSVVVGDPVRVRQVILNLMGNAIKFTERGTVSVAATAKLLQPEQIIVRFEVSDTGMGIPPDKQEHLFEAFTQADYSTTRRFGGTGLGLSISKNLVALMGGDIGVTSVLGEGSTFWFEIPFHRTAPENRVPAFAAYREILSGLRFIVSDTTTDQIPATRYLRAVGTEVVETSDLAELPKILERAVADSRPFDVAFIRVLVDDDQAVGIIEQLNRNHALTKTKLVLIVPHLSAGAAQLGAKLAFTASLSSPASRAKFYETAAYAAGLTPERSLDADEKGLNFEAPSPEEARARNCLILVAEDNQTNQFVIKNQLKRLGYAAEFVNDGREAWTALQDDRKRYGLLITDCHMPFIDGYQLTALIRERETASQARLPIIALTANALQGEAEVCYAAGMDGYLFKPTNLPALDAAIQKWLPLAVSVRKPATQETAPAKIPTTSGGGHPIDVSVMTTMLGTSDLDSLHEILELYWESECNTPEKLRELVAARDGDGLKLAAHAAKGAAASAGATIVVDLCKNLEHSLTQNNWPATDRLTIEIEAAFKDIRIFMDSSIGRQSLSSDDADPRTSGNSRRTMSR